MKRSTIGALGVVLAGASALLWGGAGVDAYPGTSPSARQAARLKWRPPAGWIRHYLGDDRYKVAGGTWKVVSTNLDTYYHRPSCPNMLRQPAGGVMGFASAADGQEAGYRADPYCAPEYSSFSYSPGSPSAGGHGGGESTTVNRSATALRITLADGVSTVLLPPNWRRTRSASQNIGQFNVQMDELRPLRGRGMIGFATMAIPGMPAGMDVGALLQPATFRAAVAGRFSGSTDVSNAPSSALNDYLVRAANLGGLRGVVLTPKRGSRRLPGMGGGPLTMVGRRSKIYMMTTENAGGIPGGGIIVKSFQPR